MTALYPIRLLDPRSERELETVTCFSVMTIWESRPELRIDPRKTPGYSWDQTYKRLKAGLRSDEARYLVATDQDKQLVGCSIAVTRADASGVRYGYFWSRYVLPRCRRAGLADRFAVDAMSWFRSKGAKYAEVHCHPENIGLRAMFGKRGFKERGRGQDENWNWLVLRKDV